jgi:hypothetical protein
MFIVNFCLNMFRASLCQSSGEQRLCYCIWCVVLILLDVVGSGCGALCCRMRARSQETKAKKCLEVQPNCGLHVNARRWSEKTRSPLLTPTWTATETSFDKMSLHNNKRYGLENGHRAGAEVLLPLHQCQTR